jgi:2-C-methyl-D-erythritol 4-phosphate cytidylyltransferase
MSLSVIIVAAGSSVRMGFDKLAAPLAGRPVLQRSLDTFLAHPAVREVIVACPADRFAMLATAAAAIPVRRVDGGRERHHSVANALAALAPGSTYVAVHDGARPLLHPADLDRCLEAAMAAGAAALARRVTETLKRSDSDNFCTAAVSRENLWFMETPQVFAVPLLREAYAAVLGRNLTATDEVSAIQAIQRPVRFIESLHPNPKITRPADLPLAEAILANR